MDYDINKFFEISMDMLCIAGVDGYFKKINRAFELTLGWKIEQLLEKPFIDFIHPDDIEKTVNEVQKLSSGFPTIIFENRYRSSEGTYKWFRWTAAPDVATGLIYAVAHDITGLKNAEMRFKLAVEAAPSSMIMVDASEKIVMVNNETERIFAYGKDELLDEKIDILVPQRIKSNHSELHKTFLSHAKKRQMGIGKRLSAIRKDGSEFPIEVGLNPIFTHDGVFVLCGINDLTERQAAEDEILLQKLELEKLNKKLEDMASKDPLTGLFNRRFLYDQMEVILSILKRETKPLSCILLDVDKFKSYNDSYGHQAGDYVLKNVAKILSEKCRKSDVVARYGGEEFLLVLPDTDYEGSLIVAEQLRKAIENFSWDNRKITASFGIATITLHIHSSITNEEMVKQFIYDADVAMYHAKETGRNRVIHFDAMV